MAKKQTSTIDFPFYSYLCNFVEQERKKIYREFRPLTKKFLNFNNPDENKSAFLRKPQFEALEMYIFLKEFLHNKKMWKIFESWYYHTDEFEGRRFSGTDIHGQQLLFGVDEQNSETTKEVFLKVFQQIKDMQQSYPNYIFALTMGLGKTVLMATSIYYEFLLADKYPKDELYCHNALIFAPDRTVRDSITDDIISFDRAKVIPPEYLDWLELNIKFHFLDDSGTTLNALDNSKYNIIISNTQKIILKREHKEKPVSQLLFESGNKYKALTLKAMESIAAEAGIDVDSEPDLTTNQRFSKLLRLPQLGVYVDEAHHVFGSKLSEDLMSTDKATSLRLTINELAENLSRSGSRLVACYNYTGTPYVGKRLLPEVVYSYGLRDAIENCYLKKVEVKDYENIRDNTETFCKLVIERFWEAKGEKRVEGMLPKIAFFASSIDELQRELRPAVEKVLANLGISCDKILVNVGDDKITSNDDLREFKNLDTPDSNKQFILLVNKGKEGWNCRSLFGVALHRVPKSKVFVLQATMRCLRQIGDYQHTGLVFLSKENLVILDEELNNNFNMSFEDFTDAGKDNRSAEVRIVPPEIKLKLKRVKKLFKIKDKVINEKVDFELRSHNYDKYKIIETRHDLTNTSEVIGVAKDVSSQKEQIQYSLYALTGEIARYLNISPLLVSKVLNDSKDGVDDILRVVNEYNEVLYDVIIPKFFKELYDIEESDETEDIEVELVKKPHIGYYVVKYKEGLLASRDAREYRDFKDRSFNVDNYCFDSVPEREMFWRLLHTKGIDKVWFTGMLTAGQTDFIINYIDPVSGGVRTYYPDFLVRKEDGSYIIVEVKGDNMIDDEIVLAKQSYAQQIAHASNMEYVMVKGTEAASYNILTHKNEHIGSFISFD